MSSPLSKQLIANLTFNEEQWKSCLPGRVIKRRFSESLKTAKSIPSNLRMCKSLNDLSDDMIHLAIDELKGSGVAKPKCINGCGTPPTSCNPIPELPHLEENNESRDVPCHVESEEEKEERKESISESVQRTISSFGFPGRNQFYFDKVCKSQQ